MTTGEVNVDFSRIECRPGYTDSNGRQLQPFGIEGKCLSPWLQVGDAVWIDRTVAPEDGDVVAISLWYDISRDPATGAVLAKPLRQRKVALKQWRVRGGETLIECNDGCFVMPRSARVLGVAVAWHRRPGEDRAPMSEMNFDQFAAEIS